MAAYAVPFSAPSVALPPPPLMSLFEKPYSLHDVTQFRRAREMYRAGESGWGLELAESLGLMRMPVGKPGGCLGCFFSTDALVWMLAHLGAAEPNYRSIFLGNFLLGVEIMGKLDTFFGPGPVPKAFLREEARTALLRVTYLFDSNPGLETVTAYARIVWEDEGGGPPSHSCMATFELVDRNKMTVIWSDPNGENPTAAPVMEAIRDFLFKIRPEWSFVFTIPPCRGPHWASMRPEPSAPEPGGYCQAWASIMILYAVASDGATPHQVSSELMSMNTTDRARFMRNFIRVVSRNAARYVRELNPSHCPGMECCAGKDYCAAFPVVQIQGAVGEQIALSDGCFPDKALPDEFIDFMFASKNGVRWFSNDQNTLGIRLVPAGSDPNLEQRFGRYLAVQKEIFKYTADTRVLSDKVCRNGAALNGAPQDVCLVLLAGKNLVPVAALLQEGAKFDPEVAKMAQAFELVGRSFGLDFRRLLLSPETLYVAHPAVPVTHVTILDADLAPPVPVTAAQSYDAEFRALQRL